MRIREYREEDAPAAGLLIAATYAEFNLSELPPVVRRAMLGPFAHADSSVPGYRRAIARAIESDTVLIAEDDSEIVGILRGRPGRLASLFVSAAQHRRGIGTGLVERFEDGVKGTEGGRIRVAATRYAVPFYQALGYRKSTGERCLKSFNGEGLPYQPMKKVIDS